MTEPSTTTARAGTAVRASSPTRLQAGRRKVASAAGITARWVVFFIAVCIILLALLLLLARFGLPWLDGYKGEVEARLSEQLQSPVSIDDLSFKWEQYGPTLSADGVVVSDSDNRQVTLDEVLLDIDLLKSISAGEPVIEELTLVGARLALETTGNGKYELHGLKNNDKPQSKTGSSVDMLSWVMGTDRVTLQDVTITLIDKNTDQQLTITDLNIVASNSGDLHQLRVDMNLPDELGGTIEMGVDLVGHSHDIRNATADFYLKATDLQADAWRQLHSGRLEGSRFSTTGIARLDANMQLALWGQVGDGRLQSARGQLEASNLVDVKSQQTVLDSLTTDVLFENVASGWKMTADKTELQKSGEVTTVDKLVYRYKPTNSTAWQLNTSGQALQLSLATTLALSLFDKDAELPRAKWLADASPSGDLKDWNASFSLTDGKPDFSLYSEFSDLQLTSAAGMPGARNINGIIDMTHNVGKITLEGQDTVLDIPSVYPTPLALQSLSSQLDVNMQDSLRTSVEGELTINDNDFTANSRLQFKLAEGKSPHVYLQGQFSAGDLSTANKVIPVRLLKPKTTRWLRQALVSGAATNGEFLMFGNVKNFPFADNDGVFRLGFDVENATLNYMQGWPQATALQGRFDMNGATLRGTASDGYVGSMRLSVADVRIDDLFNPVLSLTSTSSGSLPKLVAFGNNGPLRRLLSPALNDVSSTGRAQMDLSVDVPLKRKAAFNTVATAQNTVGKSAPITGLKVRGSVFLRGNDLAFGRANVKLDNVDGAIGFTESGIRVNNLQALMYGRPVRVDSKTEGNGRQRVTEITMSGPMRASNILDNYNIPLSQFTDGESQWRVSVRIPSSEKTLKQNGIAIAAVSGLVGTRLLLPKPLGKPVGTERRLALSTKLFPDSTEGTWLVDYGKDMKSRLNISNARLQSVAARFGPGPVNRDIRQGIRLEGTLPDLALDAWVTTIAEFIDGLEPAATPEPILPVSADMKIKSFIAGRHNIGGGTLRFNTDSTYINGVIENTWLSGNLRYPREHWRSDVPLVARIAYVDKKFFDALSSAPEKVDAKELDPRTLPPIHARIARLKWDLLDMKDLTVRTSPSTSGMNIDTFGFAYQSAQLIGNGYWRLRDPQRVNTTLEDEHVSKLNLTLQSDNFGRTLTQLGFASTLNEGEGTVSGKLVWNAPAYKPALESLVGEMDIDLQSGRILKVDPGAARLAGLFAFEALPRRLSLDFKDLVLDGLDYETVQGTVQLANGVAHAPSVQLNGSIGVLDITGESNLVTRQYNQRITVLPRVSSALPVIGIISGGATAGLGAMVAGGLLKAIGIDVDLIGLRAYTLTGGWDEPELTPVPLDSQRQ